MRNYPSIGIQIPDILLPNDNIDLTKWSVIACDQFTSQPEYWDEVRNYVNQSPSTLNLILPEVYLNKPEEKSLIDCTNRSMQAYLEQDIIRPEEGIVLIERISNGGKRHGLLLALDLEKYDFEKGSSSLIRATEGTIIDRLPPRIRIRENAILELPHILVLIDDPEKSVIEPIWKEILHCPKIYDFDLMLGSGHLMGYLVNNSNIEKKMVEALEILINPDFFHAKYGLTKNENALLFAVGDGNHSLATAKAVWEKKKAGLPTDHPLRFALVEIENIHDQGLSFEPIHRVVFGIKNDIIEALKNHYGKKAIIDTCPSFEEMTSKVKKSTSENQIIGITTSNYFGILSIDHPASNLPVGTLQEFLDGFLSDGGAKGIDYIHGADSLQKISQEPDNFGFYLPAIDKNQLFRTVILDGALPRKTFSMGEAKDKRFYLECRKIQEIKL
jgi:hypothetical protein